MLRASFLNLDNSVNHVDAQFKVFKDFAQFRQIGIGYRHLKKYVDCSLTQPVDLV